MLQLVAEQFDAALLTGGAVDTTSVATTCAGVGELVAEIDHEHRICAA